jgi:hypothetical protein
MVKFQRNFRLSGETLEQIEHLSYALHLNDTEVVERAVAEFFEKIAAEKGTRLIPREDGQYDVQCGGVTRMTIDKDYLRGIPQREIEAMLTGGSLKTQWAHLMLQTIRSGKGFTLHVDEGNSSQDQTEEN